MPRSPTNPLTELPIWLNMRHLCSLGSLKRTVLASCGSSVFSLDRIACCSDIKIQSIAVASCDIYTQRSIFGILLIWSKYGLYKHFSDWFVNQRYSVRCKVNREIVNTMQLWFHLTIFRKYFSVCIHDQYYVLMTARTKCMFRKP